MNHTVSNTCPVCHGYAKALPPTGGAIEIMCGLCGRFRVSGSSQESLKKYTREERDSFLHQAQRRAKPGDLAFIHDIR